MSPLHECCDEELLVRVVADRDQVAFTALIKRYEGVMLRVCLRVLHKRQDAEDACQTAFHLFWQKAGQICDRKEFRHWLCCVALREALRIRKRNYLHEQHESSYEWDFLVQLVQLAQPLNEMAKRERLTIVSMELRLLPEKYRTPLVLCYMEGMNKAEAAAKLALPEGTVSCRLARGRELLRRRLAHRGIVSVS
jgi:RNA polymerase sigma factor (sigma-70 family)